MDRITTVREVLESNDCAGKKYISITSMEEDEFIKSQFSMTDLYMFPHEKLFLSSVSPQDEVKLIYNPSVNNPLIMGEFVSITSKTENRDSYCLCKSMLVSDGFNVHCPNPACGLTRSTRIKRLADTPFFTNKSSLDITDYTSNGVECPYMIMADNPNLNCPFSIITENRFWGNTSSSLEKILLDTKWTIDLSTFLIESEFNNFLDNFNISLSRNLLSIKNISRFYDGMRELIDRRDYNSINQNTLISEFIWCLGIESISQKMIEGFLNYEMCFDSVESPLLPYIYLLTHPVELVKELGFHPLEASNIYKEVMNRKYELFDIFAAYSSTDLMIDTFRNMEK